MTNPTTTLPAAIVSRRDFLRTGAAAAALCPAALFAADRDDPPPDLLIGYTEFRTDLPGGRHANVKTRRAVVVKADGTGRRVLAEELTREAGYWTQFVGWSPDGKAARLSRDWKSEEVGKWEEEHKTFRTRPAMAVRSRRVPGRPGQRQGDEAAPRRGQEEERADQESRPRPVHLAGRQAQRLRRPGIPALPRRRGRLQRQADQDGPAVPPHALVVAGRLVGALCGRRALRLSPARPQGRRHGPEEAGQPQRLPRRHRLSSTCTTSTTAAATCRCGRPTASPSSTPPRWGATSSCSASRSTARANS